MPAKACRKPRQPLFKHLRDPALFQTFRECRCRQPHDGAHFQRLERPLHIANGATTQAVGPVDQVQG
jgi:hypothetical protein